MLLVCVNSGVAMCMFLLLGDTLVTSIQVASHFEAFKEHLGNK